MSRALYLCYKDFPREFMLLKVLEMSPEDFEKFTLDLARDNNVDSSSTHLVRVDGMTRYEVETLMRREGLITEENEREVLLDISSLGLP